MASNKRVYAQDISLILERTIDLAEHQLTVLEAQAQEFAIKKVLPKGWSGELQMLTKALNDLTLSHARYTKAMDDYNEKLTPDEKLAAMKNYTLSLFSQRPMLVREWIDSLQSDIDDTRVLADRLRGTPPDGSLE